MLDAVLRFPDLGVFVIHHLLMFALEREVFLLGLEDAFVLDFLCFHLCLFQDFFALSLQDGAPDKYVSAQGKNGAQDDTHK